MMYVDPKILERVNTWLTPFFDTTTQQAIKEMIAHDPEGLEDSFYKNLAFGTGGMRGVMGPGDNRINKYTLGKNTQGISNYLHKEFHLRLDDYIHLKYLFLFSDKFHFHLLKKHQKLVFYILDLQFLLLLSYPSQSFF